VIFISQVAIFETSEMINLMRFWLRPEKSGFDWQNSSHEIGFHCGWHGQLNPHGKSIQSSEHGEPFVRTFFSAGKCKVDCPVLDLTSANTKQHTLWR
jgi:hypothetical protein